MIASIENKGITQLKPKFLRLWLRAIVTGDCGESSKQPYRFRNRSRRAATWSRSRSCSGTRLRISRPKRRTSSCGGSYSGRRSVWLNPGESLTIFADSIPRRMYRRIPGTNATVKNQIIILEWKKMLGCFFAKQFHQTMVKKSIKKFQDIIKAGRED